MSESREPAAPESPFGGLSYRAVALGVVVDHVASLVYGTALTLVLASDEIASSDEAVAKAALEAVAVSPAFVLSALVGGTICTVLAAFIGARYAGDHFRRHGAWIAAGSAGIALLWFPAREAMSWLDWAGLFFIIPAGILGGALAEWSEAAEADSPPAER